jgi:hypothetical protein
VKFKPLGYRFEIVSRLSPGEATARLRKHKKPIFYAENGPRGWILGPVGCFWLSAFDRHGPMIVARITRHNLGSRIVGRAGADLNGTALFLMLTPLMAWVLVMMHASGQGTIGTYITAGIVFGLGLPLTLWVNHKDRKDADPLVRFVKKTVDGETVL